VPRSFKPRVCPIRQKSAFLPVHPDHPRISPHIEVWGPRSKAGANPLAMRDSLSAPPEASLFVVPAVAGSSPVCHPFKPGVCPIRQKSAFLPVHPDNRRISPHIEVRGRQTEGGAKPLAMRDSLLAPPKGGLIVVPAVAGSNPVCHPSRSCCKWAERGFYGQWRLSAH
jgi:hypothetical protein